MKSDACRGANDRLKGGKGEGIAKRTDGLKADGIKVRDINYGQRRVSYLYELWRMEELWRRGGGQEVEEGKWEEQDKWKKRKWIKYGRTRRRK